ncbi:MAG: CDC48 family AAA ATPase [Candidatus Thermoplasmatota archaeon]|nr:CDC48 family AAA ATPase [Candidatus Thermoplasmatota archaeon]MBS3802812.1 CDC48 family AAA ATPase [Candidatus Thermoplasmatota archaeon]
MIKKEVNLKVSEAFQQDVGYGRARIDHQTRMELDLSIGDVIEIEGKKKTASVVWRAHPTDEGKRIIRIDNLTRKNTGVGLGDNVTIKKADVKPARTVTLAPLISKGQQIQFGSGIEILIKKGLLKRPLTKGDNIIIPGIALFGSALPFAIINSNPSGIVSINEETVIKVKEEAAKQMEPEGPRVSYEDIGGLKDELERVKEMIQLPIKHPKIFNRLGIDPPKGVLLHGPPGTGKTLIAKAVANESGANFYTINGPEIMSKFYGQSEENLRKIFDEAEKNAPSIVFIDEIDAIAGKRSETHGEVEKRVVSQLLTLMDGLKGRGKLIVIGATNIPDSLDPALRRPGRFDREIRIDAPDRDGRKEIIQIHTRGMPKADNVDLERLAERTYGYVGADLAALARESAMNALRRYLPEIDLDKPIPVEVLEKMEVTMDDFKNAQRGIEPSAMREFFVEVPRVSWKDVGGLADVKQQLMESVEWPLSQPEVFKRLGINAPRGILLYGPPGTGKTLLAKAVANESDANFISIKGPEVMSKWVGESEKAVRELFKKAKQVAPSIVFLDELDAIAPRRGAYSGSHVTESVVNQLLTSVDGLESMEGVIIIGATNRPDIIDSSLLRPGRFDRLIMTPSPDTDAREEIFKIHTKNMPLGADVSLKDLADDTDGFSGADIEALCRESAMIALRENIKVKKVKKDHFTKAMHNIRASLTDNLIEYYKKVSKQLGSGIAKKDKRDKDIQYM